jgi:hypothetical protein
MKERRPERITSASPYCSINSNRTPRITSVLDRNVDAKSIKPFFQKGDRSFGEN